MVDSRSCLTGEVGRLEPPPAVGLGSVASAPLPPPRCGARTQVKGPAGGQLPLVTAGPFPQCQSRRQRRREGRCSCPSHLGNRNSVIKRLAQKMEIFGQAFRDLIKINIMPYGSRKLSTAHVEESI